MTPPSLRRNFVWSAVGTTAYNVAQWGLLVALAKLGSPHLVGQFALMLAIAAPVYLSVGLNLRVVRATDVRRVWTARQYYSLRQLLNAVSLVVTLTVGLFLGFNGTALVALFFVCVAKSVETTSLMLYGFFQLRERLDLVARSLLLRAVAGTAGFVGLLAATGRLAPASAGMALGWFAVWVGNDRPQERLLLSTDRQAMQEDGVYRRDSPQTVSSLARKALPLGVDSGIVSSSTNVPRYAVQLSYGSAALGGYAALSYAAVLVSTVAGTLGDTLVGRLAKQAERRDAVAFRRLLIRFLIFGLSSSALMTTAAWLFGAPVVRTLLGPEYVNQPVLIILMLSAGAVTLQRSLVRGLQAAHHYSSILMVDSVILAGSVVLALLLVPFLGLKGAAASLGMANVAGILISGAVMVRVVRTMDATSKVEVSL